MHVAADAVGLVAHDQRHLGVRLETGETVDDVRADALQVARPMDVVLFVEARFELDQHRDLLAVLGSFDQRVDDRRVAARGAVQRLLDREHVRIDGRLTHELHDRIERLVRVVQEHVAFADHREDIGRADQRLGIEGVNGGRNAMPGSSRFDERHEIRYPEHARRHL